MSGVAFTSRQRAAEAARLGRQTALLQGYSRDVVAAGHMQAIVSVTCKTLATLFQVPAVVMLVTDRRSVRSSAPVMPNPRRPNWRRRDRRFRLEPSRAAAFTKSRLSRFDFWPVETADGQRAVIGLAFDPDERPAAPDAPIQIVAGILALVLERRHARAGRDAGTH